MLNKPWREAATLIIFARDAAKSSKFDYKMLTFTRTEKTSFFENTLNFPGGAIHRTDESPNWTQFFKHHKIPSEQLRTRPAGVKKPFIYDPQPNKIEREISLRLAAIRETFEELGIVMCSPASSGSSKSPFSDYFHSKDCDIPFWQEQIHNSHKTLANFCDNFNLVPNIMDLYEWSVWLSPVFFKKRYETAVFMTFLESIPPCYPESHEVQDYSWKTPEEIIAAHRQQTSWLPPHLYYEIHRFLDHKSIDEISNFAKKRTGNSLPLIFPVHYFLKDSMALVYPGDDLYPQNASFHEKKHEMKKFKDKSYDEFMDGCKNFCRVELQGLFACRFLCNIDDGLLKAKSDGPEGKL